MNRTVKENSNEIAQLWETAVAEVTKEAVEPQLKPFKEKMKKATEDIDKYLEEVEEVKSEMEEAKKILSKLLTEERNWEVQFLSKIEEFDVSSKRTEECVQIFKGEVGKHQKIVKEAAVVLIDNTKRLDNLFDSIQRANVDVVSRLQSFLKSQGEFRGNIKTHLRNEIERIERIELNQENLTTKFLEYVEKDLEWNETLEQDLRQLKERFSKQEKDLELLTAEQQNANDKTQQNKKVLEETFQVIKTFKKQVSQENIEKLNNLENLQERQKQFVAFFQKTAQESDQKREVLNQNVETIQNKQTEIINRLDSKFQKHKTEIRHLKSNQKEVKSSLQKVESLLSDTFQFLEKFEQSVNHDIIKTQEELKTQISTMHQEVTQSNFKMQVEGLSKVRELSQRTEGDIQLVGTGVGELKEQLTIIVELTEKLKRQQMMFVFITILVLGGIVIGGWLASQGGLMHG